MYSVVLILKSLYYFFTSSTWNFTLSLMSVQFATSCWDRWSTILVMTSLRLSYTAWSAFTAFSTSFSPISWNSSSSIVRCCYHSLSLVTHCCRAFNFTALVICIIEFIAQSNVLSAYNWPPPFHICVFSWSNCSSWTKHPQNCLVASMIVLD